MHRLISVSIFQMLVAVNSADSSQPPLENIQKMGFESTKTVLDDRVTISDERGPLLTIKNIHINGLSNHIIKENGGNFLLEFEFKFICVHCKRALNQLLIGLDIEHTATACLYNGKPLSDWKKINVEINIPDIEGRYFVRALQSAAFNCKDALDWWRINSATGPGEKNTIGSVRIRKQRREYELNYTQK